MAYNLTRFDVKKLELKVKGTEGILEIADMLKKELGGQPPVELDDGNKFWINRNHEGIEMRFRKEKGEYVLEHIRSSGTFSGYLQDFIMEVFKKYNGKIHAERTWEDGERNTLKIGY
ncbi:MAG: hypothetical protein V1645_03875 [archaeon]